MNLRGRSVLVTGASSGIGAATAKRMGREGAVPVLLARRRDRLDAVLAEIGGGGRAYAVDCSDRDAVAAVAADVLRDVGVPDVLVNSAGAGRFLLFDDTEPAEFEQMMAAPYFATVYVTRAFLPAMLERGGGHVVTVNSPIAWAVWPHAAGYAAARWALRGLTDALRADLHGTPIKVTQVVAGKTETPYFDAQEGSADLTPRVARLLRTLSADEVAAAVVRAVESERRTVYAPPLLRAFIAASRLFPGLVGETLVRTGRTRATGR